jgi:hypothetical protein
MDQRSKAQTTVAVALSLKPQARKVLRHLETYGYITPGIADRTYRIPRLAASICEIRKKGVKVATHIKRDAMGQTYARYEIVRAA